MEEFAPHADFVQANASFASWLQAVLVLAQQNAAELKAAQLKIEALTFELAYLRRIRFGRTSEAILSSQQSLFGDAIADDANVIEAETVEQPTHTQDAKAPITRRPRTKPTGRQPLPDNLPRIEHRHELDTCICGQCNQALVKIGEDVSEQLDVEPARFFVHRHIRPQYACRTCETVVAQPTPPAIIDGGLAAPGLHAWVLIQKYCDHLPLYRIEQICARHGVSIARSTLAEWVGKLGLALQPLVDRLCKILRAQKSMHADETPVRQLDPGAGKTKRAYLWAYRSNDLENSPRIVIFNYQNSRAGQHVQNFLHNWQGHLMVDDYAGYKALFGRNITELACLAHMRRKFFDLHAANQNTLAAEALQKIGELYAIEHDAKDKDAHTRLQIRQTHALPKVRELRDWLLITRTSVAEGGGMAKAIDYSLKRWNAFERYLTCGTLPIDNNPLENAIRPIAIGKKNWLFVGSETAGEHAAAIQSLVATAKLNDIDPYAWLKDTLEKLPTWPNAKIDELLPLRRKSSNIDSS